MALDTPTPASPDGSRTMTRATSGHRVVIDPEAKRLANDTDPPRGMPTANPPSPVSFELHYLQPEPDRLVLEGTFDRRKLKVRLHKVDQSEFLLRNRGFHWINETPYNVALPRGAPRVPASAGR